MKKLLKIITGVTLSLAMAIGVGIGVASNNKKAEPVYATPTNAFSFTRSGTNNTVTNGYAMVLTNYSGQSGYYQDKNSTVGLDIGVKKTSGTIWSSTPTSISLTVKVGGGSTKNPLGNNLIANLIDASGNEIANTSVIVTNKVETTTGKDYVVSVPVANNAAGIMLHHEKETSYNIRVYTISMSYEAAGGGNTPATYSVTYDPNGATSGSVPTDSTAYTSGQTVTVLGNTGVLAKTHYTWSSWNTAPDGSGNGYNESETFSITSNTTLYAQWLSDPTYTITYHDTNKTSGSSPADATPHFEGDAVTVLGNTNTLARTGYVWAGWSLNSDGSGLAYGPTYISKYTIGTSNVDFYPIWLPAYDEELAFHFAGSTVSNDSSYAARSATVDSQALTKYNAATWQITVGNDSAQLGTNAKAANLSKSTLGEGDFEAAAGLASALGITTSTQKYSAAICTTPMTDIYEIDLFFSGTNGGNITTAWVLSSTNGTLWEIEAEKTANIVTQSKFTFFKNTDARQYAFIAYWNLTNSGGLKDFELKMFGEYQTITASSDSSYTDQTITLTTSADTASWSISANTADASLSAANGKTTVVSANQAGSVTIQASAAGYGVASKTINFSTRPVSPFVTLDDDSVEGFTGQPNVIIGFDYGNFNGDLGISTENSNVNASIQNDTGNHAEASISFVNAGSCEVYIKDGSTTLGTINVIISASTVSISGMPAAKTISNGNSLNFGSLITVTPVGSCSSAVGWTSSAPSVAEVNSSGVVTALKPGTTVVTASPDDYPSGAVSCTVTVVNDKAILASSISSGDIVFLGCRGTSMQYNGPSTTSTVYGLGIAFNNTLNVDGLTLEVEDGNAENSFAFRITSGDYEDQYLTWINDKDKINNLAVANSVDDNSSWNVDIDGDGNASITNVATPARRIWWNVTNPRFACYTDKTDGDSYKYVQLWKLDRPESHLDFSTTFETLHGHENYTAEVLTSVDSVAIRFGATVSKTNWDAIKANWTISDYGVMLMKEVDLDNSPYISLEEAFNDGASSSILKIVNKRAGGAAYADPYLDGDNYLFTVKVSFPDNYTYYDDRIYAVPFVVISDQSYFFNETNITIHELAYNCIGTGYEYLSDAALEFIFDAH